MSSRPSKRKLIFLWTYTNWGGAQVYFFAIMKLAREEWDIVVILPEGSRPDLIAFLDDLGVKYEFADIRFDPQPETTLIGKLARQFRRVRSEVKTYRTLKRFDLRESVLHIEVAPWQSWILLTALAIRRANVFATLHNFQPEISALRRIVWKFRFAVVSRLPCFHVFASNKDTKESLRNWVTRKFWEDIKVTYTCVDPVQIATARAWPFDRDAERERFGLPTDAFAVLAVGQFIDRKGRWTFLDAASKFASEPSDIVFVWVMPEEINEADKLQVEEYRLGKAFVPILSRSIGSDRLSILRFFRLADAFALPSFVEGLPIALLEAMAIGIPSISTNVYAIPEAVIDCETGILIEAGDSDALAEAVARLRNDAELRRKLSMQGSEFVLKNFDERETASTCIAAYKAGLGE